MRHGSELGLHLLTRIEQHQARSAGELARVRREVTELATWLKHVGLLVALYGSGLTLLLLSEEKAELLIRFVQAVKGSGP